MRTVGTALMFMLALMIFIASVFLSGCAEGRLRTLADDQKAQLEAIGDRGERAARDLNLLEETIAATPPKADGSPDFATIVGSLNRDPAITTDTRLAISGLAAAGKSPEQIVRALQGQLATEGRALLSAFEQGKLELDRLTREADKARDRDDAWWGLGELGALAVAGFLPGAGAVIGRHFGLAKGIIRGRKEGAELTARHVAAARAVDPAIDAAFANSPQDATLRSLLATLPDEVRLAIVSNKTASKA